MQRILILLVLLVTACGSASAARAISVAAKVGAFFPTSSGVRDNFGDTWLQLSAGQFERQRVEKWKLDWDLTILDEDDEGDVLLIPLTIGMARTFNPTQETQPYVAVRIGPYYGDVDVDSLGIDETEVGFNANASVGLIYKKRYSLELRYDYFSDLGGFDFNGLTLSAGIRLFDIKL